MINLFLTYSVYWGVEKIADLEGFVQCNCGLPVIRQTLLEKYNEYANLKGLRNADDLNVNSLTVLDSAAADVLSEGKYITIESNRR